MTRLLFFFVGNYVDLDTGAWTDYLRTTLGNEGSTQVKLSHIKEFELTSLKCKIRHLSEELSAGDHVLIAGIEYEIQNIDPFVSKKTNDPRTIRDYYAHREKKSMKHNLERQDKILQKMEVFS